MNKYQDQTNLSITPQLRQSIIKVNGVDTLVVFDPVTHSIVIPQQYQPSDRRHQWTAGEIIAVMCGSVICLMILGAFMKWFATPKIVVPYTNTQCQPGNSVLWGLYKTEQTCNTQQGYGNQ